MAHAWWGMLDNHIVIWAISGSVGCNLQRKKMARCERGQRCSFTTTKYLYAFTCCRVIGINYFSKFLQTSLNYNSIKNKLGSVIERLKLIQEGLEDYDAIDSSLVHFHKVVRFLTISAERMELARPHSQQSLA